MLLDLEKAFGEDEEVLAGLRQAHPFALAVEQQHVVILLQPADLLRQRRLGLEDRLCSARKAAVKGDAVKGLELAVAHTGTALFNL